MNRVRRCKNDVTAGSKGFTIVELLVVTGIMAVLIVIAVPLYMSFVDKARIIQAASALDTARKDFEVYFNEKSSYPLTVNFTNFTDQNGDVILNAITLADLKKKLYSWEGYFITGNIFTLRARAKDSNHTLITVTPQDIDY